MRLDRLSAEGNSPESLCRGVWAASECAGLGRRCYNSNVETGCIRETCTPCGVVWLEYGHRLPEGGLFQRFCSRSYRGLTPPPSQKTLLINKVFLLLTTPLELKSFQKPLSAAKVAAAASAARFADDSGGPAAASVAHSFSETPLLRGPRWMGLLSTTSPGDPRGGAPAPLRL
jgi:hypothetical protein